MEQKVSLENVAQRGQLLLSTLIEDLEITDAYAKITGTFSNPEEKGITGDGNKLTVSESATYLITGISDLNIDVNGTPEDIYYSMYVNGVGIGAETKHTFGVKSKFENIAITSFLYLSKDDYIEVFVKSTSATNKINIASLSVVLLKV